VGEACAGCQQGFQESDSGLLLPNEDGEHEVGFHRSCFLKAVGVENLARSV
jgi:hypothetical protein